MQALAIVLKAFFQALRRVYRYGQKKEVDCYIVTSEAEINVLANIKRKEDEFLKMVSSVIDETRALVLDEIKQITQKQNRV